MTEEEPFAVPRGERQLFLDDRGIDATEGLRRTMHPPAKKGAVIRPAPDDPQANSLQIRTAPVWDPVRELYQLWDCITPNDLHAKRQYCCGYYESKDGLHWSKPVVGQVERNGSRENNYMAFRGDRGQFGPSMVVYDAADPDPARRYKAALPAACFAVSPDGLKWEMLDVPAVPSSDESNFSLDETEHLFILTVKHGGPYGRSVWLSTSRDFERWTEPELIFHADDEDQELGRESIEARLADPRLQQPFWNDPAAYNVDVYNMGVFRYEGLYIGMPAMYHAVGPVPDYPNTVGFHLVQLACSRDLKSWQRLGGRKPFIGPSALGSGAYDLTQILPPSRPIVRGEELWFYYTGIKYRGGFECTGADLDPDPGAICLAVLRRDGFVSLDAGDEAGVLVTRPFVLKGKDLCVNVSAPGGSIRVEVLDGEGKSLAASEPLSGDHPRGQICWAQDGLASLNGRDVKLRFTLRNASFYSYWFEE